MPWLEVSVMSLRHEFVTLALQEGLPFRALCRRFGVTPRTGYKWLRRFQAAGTSGLTDRSRQPHRSPTRTPPALEDAVLRVRAAPPAWGGRKIHAVLRREGFASVPSPSTITAILHRHGHIAPEVAARHRPVLRFVHAAPNDLWQMDFKGHIPLAHGRAHPLTVLDDHSRYALGLEACADEQRATVHERLTTLFRRYGLPTRMVMDNGPPWGHDPGHRHTPLTVWLLRLGIGVSHGRPAHPQTQGKDERFHRTLVAEVLAGRTLRDLAHCQAAFSAWRPVYNHLRPHEALDMAVPAERYQVSPRPFPEELPPVEYEPGARVRKVQDKGVITFQGRRAFVGQAFHGYPVALRPMETEGLWGIYFLSHRIAQIDLRAPDTHK